MRFEVGGPKAEREFGATSSHCKVLERERGFQNEVFSSFFLCVKVRKVNSREKGQNAEEKENLKRKRKMKMKIILRDLVHVWFKALRVFRMSKCFVLLNTIFLIH